MKLIILFLVVTLISGCGYQFAGGGSILPPDVKKIYIPMVENSSSEAGYTVILTEALRDRFERFGAVSVVEDLNEADAVLKTRLLKLDRDTQSVTSRTDTALELNTTLTLSSELRRVDGSVLWSNPRLTVSRAFGTTSEAVVTGSADFASGSIGASDLGALSQREIARGQEQEALSNLADQTAKVIYDQAVSPDF